MCCGLLFRHSEGGVCSTDIKLLLQSIQQYILHLQTIDPLSITLLLCLLKCWESICCRVLSQEEVVIKHFWKTGDLDAFFSSFPFLLFIHMDYWPENVSFKYKDTASHGYVFRWQLICSFTLEMSGSVSNVWHYLNHKMSLPKCLAQSGITSRLTFTLNHKLGGL